MQAHCKILLLYCALMAAGSRGKRNEIERRGEKKPVVDKLDQILQEMTSHGSQRPTLGLHFMELRDYVETPNRKYTVIVLFSPPDPTMECILCQYVYAEFYTVANSYALASPGPPTGNICFVVVDLAEASGPSPGPLPPDAVLAPSILMFKRNCRGFDPQPLNYHLSGMDAVIMARWVYRHTDVRIKIVRLQAYERLLYLAGVSVIVARVLAGLGLRWETLVARRTLATVAVGFCCHMTGGVMWNRIQEPRLFIREITDCKKQSIVDTYVMTVMYGAVVAGMILIIEARGGVLRGRRSCPSQLRCVPTSPPATDLRLLSGLGLVCVFFSAILSFYRFRMQAYPFHFLFP